MEEKRRLTDADTEADSGEAVAATANMGTPIVHKAVKKKSTIVKLVLFSLLLVIGLIFCFVPMQFGFTDYHPFCSKESISLGLDLQGGVYAVYEVPNYQSIDGIDEKMKGTRSSLEAMITGKGYTEATVVIEGANRFRVEIPDVDEPAQLLKIIGDPVQIEFVLTKDPNNPIITGEDIENATWGYQESQPVVMLRFTSDGGRKFGEATSANVGEYMDIYITRNGVRDTNPISHASINSAITNGNAIIQGGFTEATAEDLANQIMSGTFDLQLKLKESETVSPTLGNDALKYGLIAGVVGFVLVIAFMCIVYRMLGFGASLALIMYVVLYMFFLAALPWVQLTLPGIAGILLSIGMAVDANIIIFERIKDEYRNGKSIMAAYHAGFKKALFAILDSNVTTVIACILLLLLGTGSVSGFALTLLVGVLLSLFSSLVISRGILHWFINLNSYSEKLFGLKRGKMFSNLSADSTDAGILEVMKREEEQKQRDKEEKKKLKELEKNARSAHRAKETQGGESL